MFLKDNTACSSVGYRILSINWPAPQTMAFRRTVRGGREVNLCAIAHRVPQKNLGT
jgi:hypothetical protein